MDLATVLANVKAKLDIASADTTFDTYLEECIEQAFPRLSPFLQYQLPEDETTVLATGDDTFDLPEAGSKLERMYFQTTANDVWREVDLWRQHRDTIYLTENVNTATTVKIIAHRPFISDDIAELATDYPASLLPLYLFTMSEFAMFLVGNKRKFNIYQQMNGSRTLDEMKDLTQFYEERAVRILEDEISSEGQ